MRTTYPTIKERRHEAEYERRETDGDPYRVRAGVWDKVIFLIIFFSNLSNYSNLHK